MSHMIPHPRGIVVSVQLFRSLDFLQAFAVQLTGRPWEKEVIVQALVDTWRVAPADVQKSGWHLRGRSIRYLRGIHFNRETALAVGCWAGRALGRDTPVAEAYPLFRALVELRGVRPWSLHSFKVNAFGHRERTGERRRHPSEGT